MALNIPLQDQSLSSLQRTLLVALLVHFQTQPLAFLVDEVFQSDGDTSGLRLAVQSLPPQVCAYVRKTFTSLGLKCKNDNEEVKTKLLNALLVFPQR
jgi:hypothetical protein